MLQIIKKLFCMHQWKTHAKETYEWTEKEVVEGTMLWPQPLIQDKSYQDTVEILICEKCGDVKKLSY